MNDHADRIEAIAMALHRAHCAGLPSERWRTWSGEDDTQREHFRRAARAAIAALEAGRSSDWVLVPRGATVEMVAAAREAGAAFGFGHHYAKAIAAAPQQPTPVGVTDAD